MDKDLQQKLEMCRDLPSHPGVAGRLLELSEQPDVELDALAEALSRDAALTAKMLRAANSPLYGYRRSAETLKDAVMFMGIDSAVSLALTFTLASPMRQASASSPTYQRLWQRSALSAMVADQMAKHLSHPRRGNIFLAAILADIGMFTLLQVEGKAYERIAKSARSHDRLSRVERETYGSDHADVGAWLLDRWHVPAHICEMVRSSSCDVASLLDDSCAIVALSWRVAEYLLLDEAEEAMRESLVGQSRRILGDGAEGLMRLMESLQEQVPNLNQMMQSDVLSASAREMMMDRAKELLMIRQIKMMGEFERMKSRIERFEHRTEELARAAALDGMTKLLSRASFDTRLEESYAAARAEGKPLALIMIDVDDFRVINDRYGHVGGDQAIKWVARIVRDMTPESGYAARYGGDEFVMVLPDCGTAEAVSRARRIKKAIERREVRLYRGSASLTVSAGAASCDPESALRSVWDLVGAADEALYESKHGGKNRVTSKEAKHVA